MSDLDQGSLPTSKGGLRAAASTGGNRLSLRQRLTYLTAAICAVITLVALAGAWSITALGPAPVGNDLVYSKLVLDREGRLLRAYATPNGYWRLPVSVGAVDPRFLTLLFAYEDKRFREHFGVDPRAMLRATYQFLRNGHIVSGASTLTMQVARLIEPRPDRTVLAKLRQIARAVELERRLSKDEILNLYLNLAPYGGNLEGIRAASLAYFGREPRRLTLGEAALLVALPQSPEARRPDRANAAARRARDRVLDRAAAAGAIPHGEAAHAKAEPVPTVRRSMPMLAPHAADQVMAIAPDRTVHRLTIDAFQQRSLEYLARERAPTLGPDVSVAIVAIDNASGDVLARVGSGDYFDERRAGQVDMTGAVRSPGSALKPFIYGLGFEDGLMHPETLIDDRPARYGGYAPENFDLTFQGTVTVRQALQFSLNVPAVAVLDKVGASRLTARLANAGAALQLPKGEAPGLAMALGGVGIRLTDLTMLYSGIARLGTTLPATERADRPPGSALRLIDPVAAWYVGNVLIGAPPPENGVRGRIAFKTGTSYGYRDAWAVGFDGKRTIGVWVGRADGAPVPGMIGRTAAAPVLFDAFARTGRIVRLPPPPKGVIFAPTAKLPQTLVRFRPSGLVGGAPPPRIVFPQNGVRLDVAGTGRGKLEPVGVKVAGGTPPLTVLVNGSPVAGGRGHRTLFFDPDGPGFLRLTVMDATGAADSVVVRIQ
ncbi:MAG: penicillin-binding protein 1C [Rhizobiales bacterium]|nr:penicillin-binding protein 1C [Hyphomicrobiales bacterium]